MIKISIREAEKVNGDTSAFIAFDYDSQLVGIMRGISPRHWEPTSRIWEIPATRLGDFVNQVQGHEIELTGTNVVAKPIQLPANFNFKTTPFNHQIEGFEYGLKYDKFLLGDEQGLGKTKQAIDIGVAKKQIAGYKHCLIVCGVNGLKWNWRHEVGVHSNEDSYILGTRYTKKGKEIVGTMEDRLLDLDNLPDAYFIITNIETLRGMSKNLGTKKQKKMVYPIADKLGQLCSSGEIGMVVVDEIHKCKNSDSQQGESLLKLLPKTRIGMSGTPLMNSPLDLFMILKWLGFEKHSSYQFKKHYCVLGGFGGKEVVGYRNLNELQENLDGIMLRRLKKNVLDLPEKLYVTDYVEMGTEQTKIYNEVKKAIMEEVDKIKLTSNPLAQLIRLRQATGFTGILSTTTMLSAKLDRLEEIVEEAAENGEKCIVFSNWTDVTTPAYKRLKRFNPAIITGETKDRVAEQDLFMKDPTCKCIIGTIGAMGTGLTLTEASIVIFLDEPWNRANKEQAEDRAHRIGTTSNVTIITIICKDTIDERIAEIVQKKGVMADAIVDGNVVGNNRSDLIDFLLS